MERVLADMERAFFLLDQGTRFNGVQTVKLRGPVDVALLQKSLSRMQERHPLLRIRLRGDDARLVITDEDSGPLPLTVLPRHSDTDWIAVAETELNRPFLVTDDHLTRLVLLRGDDVSELVLAHHHLTADALSILFLIRDLLTDLETLRHDQTPEPPFEPSFEPPLPSLPLRPPMPDLLPKRARGLSLLVPMNHFFWKHVVARPFRRAVSMPQETRVPPDQRQNRLVHRALPPPVTRALLSLAKQQRTTLHGALSAALLLATTHEVFSDRVARQKTTRVGCFAAVNLRGVLPPEVREEMGLYISQVTTFHRVIPEPSFWDLSRQVRARLTRTLAHGEQYLTLPLIGLFIPRSGQVARRFVRRFDGASPGLTGLTNLQTLPIPLRYGALSILDHQVTVGVSVVGQLLLAVTTVRDKLNLNFIYLNPLVSPDRAQRIADAVVLRLTQAAEREPQEPQEPQAPQGSKGVP